jgi:hypothetical protein
MKKTLTLILLLTSFNSFAFDYHGIQSGMTKDEVKALLECADNECVVGDEDSPADNPALDLFFEETKPANLKKLEFAYTQDEKLWRIRLHFQQYKFGIAMPAGFKLALEEKYPDASIDEEVDRSGYFPKTNYYAFLIDSELFLEDVNYWKEKFKQTF